MWEDSVTELYVVGSPRGPKKVGVANNPVLRLKQLRTGSSRRLELLFTTPAPDGIAVDIERRAHWLLREKKTHGEWFAVSAKEAIDAVQRALMEGGAGEKQRPSVGRPPLKRNVETVLVALRLPADVVARMDERAGDGKRSEWLRRLIANELRKPFKSNPPTPPSPAKSQDAE